MASDHPSQQGAAEHALLAELLERYQQPLTRFVYHLVHEREEARDVVQETFLCAWRVAQRHGPPFAADSDDADRRRWLFRVAWRRAVSAWRRHRQQTARSLDLMRRSQPSQQSELDESAWFEDRLVEAEVLQRALAALSPEDTACLLLHVVQGFTSVEVARILEISAEAARKRLSRALQRLRASYLAQTAAAPAPSESGGSHDRA